MALRTKTKVYTKKVNGTTCYFTQNNSKPDYKDVLILRRFINDRGKIIRQSVSGVTAKNQRMLTQAVKRARYMALLPYTDRHSL
ncbi:30S ribosomal protein S18 [candidate division WWE3 bacterium RIFCSPHIGHO2_12_FULL_38_15]|uniref:Small ribosomal subunit protein bS18 n=1 Tax=candidate division WWE3 bacterium RIFCSPHIGHO2_02_FULL_38_14 TaxID=1802620 RepID=A0A1F4V799_UNCKA|nr:MAG: 30S ribosomal protein S18 [candidate division WWE3 bacterium RIFCSPHIGHO2_01_FULL_38_45]OGC48869.1 MAG: 30S ribosomal protein S18 [candidate division WWE3 bacterium RIFCSPHIGHO2_12_FULL_38_15]OGC53016.1 MAG: 30S ribosomal protein S18 [candidate division WWE3 bacterium RIFCSPHIGHO2_02_FULL_38_14]OGC53172.1 MAG: 30S ribosomal protein S18 [candidate division WWE3 bacterium RIFCSPLOWO2_01_FULL_37_24]HLB52017.1 30S ribosomal protein S18 [Patescibacteria group bacterium]